jgi:hypothetical protein
MNVMLEKLLCAILFPIAGIGFSLVAAMITVVCNDHKDGPFGGLVALTGVLAALAALSSMSLGLYKGAELFIQAIGM